MRAYLNSRFNLSTPLKAFIQAIRCTKTRGRAVRRARAAHEPPEVRRGVASSLRTKTCCTGKQGTKSVRVRVTKCRQREAGCTDCYAFKRDEKSTGNVMPQKKSFRGQVVCRAVLAVEARSLFLFFSFLHSRPEACKYAWVKSHRGRRDQSFHSQCTVHTACFGCNTILGLVGSN